MSCDSTDHNLNWCEAKAEDTPGEIFEVGITYGGLSVISRRYGKAKIDTSSQLVFGLLNCLDAYAQEHFEDYLESFTYMTFNIVLAHAHIELGTRSCGESLLAYAITKKCIPVDLTREKLQKLLRLFLEEYVLSDIQSRQLILFKAFIPRIDTFFSNIKGIG